MTRENDMKDESDMIIIRSRWGWSLLVNDGRPFDEALIASADSLPSLTGYAETLGTYEMRGDCQRQH